MGTGEENTKDKFYEQIYNKLSENVIKLVIGDLNVSRGRLTHFIPIIGREIIMKQLMEMDLYLYPSQSQKI